VSWKELSSLNCGIHNLCIYLFLILLINNGGYFISLLCYVYKRKKKKYQMISKSIFFKHKNIIETVFLQILQRSTKMFNLIQWFTTFLFYVVWNKIPLISVMNSRIYIYKCSFSLKWTWVARNAFFSKYALVTVRCSFAVFFWVIDEDVCWWRNDEWGQYSSSVVRCCFGKCVEKSAC